MTTIDIRDVGPIASVSIPVPAEGGVVVLRGPNGSGKSIALSAVDALTRDGKATPAARARDGSLGGSVDGLGRAIKVGLQRSTSKGELEVTALDDGVDIAALVDPGFSDPSAADRARIKAALLLARVSVDVAPFADLVGGLDQLRSLVRADALAATDPVEMAARVRRDLHAAALTKEREADAREASAKGLREASQGSDLSLDEQAIRAESEDAVANKRALEQRAADSARNSQQRAAATAAIEAAGPDPDLDALQADLIRTADEDLAAARAENDTRAAYEAAKQRAAKARVEAAAARRAKEEATAFAAKMAQARKALAEIGDVVAPTPDEIASAAARVTTAHEAVARLGAADEARKQIYAANLAASDAKRIRAESETLRDAAKGTDEILARLLAGFAPAGLGVYDGRLVIRDGDRQKYFAELSDGERWRIALDMAMDALGDARILAISQLAWEGLDSDARAAIHAHAKTRRTVIVTAEADHEAIGTLRAEEFSA